MFITRVGSSLCVGYFWDRVSQTICQGWLPALVLLISASWGARIIGVSHWCLAQTIFFRFYYLWPYCLSFAFLQFVFYLAVGGIYFMFESHHGVLLVPCRSFTLLPRDKFQTCITRSLGSPPPYLGLYPSTLKLRANFLFQILLCFKYVCLYLSDFCALWILLCAVALPGPPCWLPLSQLSGLTLKSHFLRWSVASLWVRFISHTPRTQSFPSDKTVPRTWTKHVCFIL
jgi:hypothetical protein